MTDSKPIPPQAQPDLGTLGFLVAEHQEDRKLFRAGMVTAIAVHLIAFALTWPTLASAPPEAPEKPRLRVVKLHIFEPPDPLQVELPQVPRAREIPIPDPTPDEPEPYREMDVVSDQEPPIGDIVHFDVEPPPIVEDPGPVIVDVHVKRPEVLHKVEPSYTDAALKARIEGVVIVQLIIGTDGRVSEATVLRGLPLGLTEQAMTAVKQWVFEPSTLNGRPVPVQYNLTISFRVR